MNVFIRPLRHSTFLVQRSIFIRALAGCPSELALYEDSEYRTRNFEW